MNLNASGRAALIVAAGLWVSALAPLHAQTAAAPPDQGAQPVAVGSAADTSAEPAKPARHHTRKAAAKPRKPAHQAKAKPADATADAGKTDDATSADAKPATDTAAPDNAAMAPNIANANAQWPAADNQPANTYNMSAQAGTVLNQMGTQSDKPATAAPDDSATTAQVVAPDQLNELDRAAEDKPQLTLAQATLDTPAAPAVTASNDSNSPWTQTSMVGKIFIAFGGLLTLASAARMFMA